MFAAPAEGTLKHFMEFAETGFADHEQSPPDQRTHATEHYAKLINRNRRYGRFRHASSLPKPTRTPSNLTPRNLPLSKCAGSDPFVEREIDDRLKQFPFWRCARDKVLRATLDYYRDPAFPEMEKDHAHLKGHPWLLCYILAAQSDSAEDLEEAWKQVCREGHTQFVPQYVIALDTGFLYCGLRKPPCPRYPGNYTEAEDVSAWTGIY